MCSVMYFCMHYVCRYTVCVCAVSCAFMLTFSMQKEVPFAVVGSRDEVEVGGKRSRVRKYPWGMVEGDREKRVVFSAV